nr:unnamed protein product [Digitaria exilis]
MLAARPPISLHHRTIAGGQRRRCVGGSERKRDRALGRHFTQALESLWRHSPRIPPPPRPAAAAAATRGEANPSWQPPVLENAAFEEYYKIQQIVRREEWDAFMSVLRKPLPATFRINASCQFYKDICSKLENDFRRPLESEVSNEYGEDAVRPLPWYPGNLAWHLNFSRKELRKNQALEGFHEFLKHESEVGNITRQEAVSMVGILYQFVPPLFLDVQPDHCILDMCAAPGSKTFQLLEMIHQSKEPGLLPRALVIANDLNVQRCDLLIHNTKRMCTANLIVTNHEAEKFPDCSLEKDYSEAYKDTYRPQRLEFDRILCDVPCSGDGTIRKGHDMWRKWNSGMGNQLHLLQVNIAMHGIELLKVGGRVVYSTCSMNPVENEAVVAEVQDRGSWLQTHDDVPKDRKNVVLPSMFPSNSTDEERRYQRHGTKIQHILAKGRIVHLQKEPEQETRPYETILTRQQNNGSEEVDDAELLCRRQNLSTDNQTTKGKNSIEPEMVFDDVESGQAEVGERMTKLQKQSRWKGIDPVLFFKDEVVIKSIISFFGIKESFPLQGHLVTRSTDNARRIYYISKSVKEILELNAEVGEQLKIASLGVKMFVSINY